MLTALAVIWIVNIALCIRMYTYLDDIYHRSNEKFIWPVVSIAISIVLGITISTDLASRGIRPNSFFLWGFVVLGVFSFVYFSLNLKDGDIDLSNLPDGGGLFSFIITAVGFISSVLGIIAFYLEYLQ